MSARRGIYFLANNKVYDLAIAFLNSFREHNKDIELCLIPFNEDSHRISELKDEYNFTVFDNKEILAHCDDISIKFHQKQLGAYRKFAAWEGEFDEFAYIDLDTVVLDSIDFVFEHLNEHPIFTSHANSPGLVQWVWKDSIYEKKKLSQEQIGYAANTGFFVSKKKLISLDIVLSKVDAALELKDDMVLYCMEQPFLNYMIVTSGYSYSSLSQMLENKPNLNIKLECWAGSKNGIVKGGAFYIPNQPQYFLVHWAGIWHERNGSLHAIPYRNLWTYYRNLNKKYLLPKSFGRPYVVFLNSFLSFFKGAPSTKE